MVHQKTRRHRIRKRCLAVLGMMVPLLLVVAALTLPADARIPQHRVKRAVRSVEYDEIRTNIKSRKFWIPNSVSDKDGSPTKSRRTTRMNSLAKESSVYFHDENNLWHLHVTGDLYSINKNQRRLIDDYGGFEIDNQTEEEEEEPYQDSVIGSDKNQTWNVSTEIDYGFANSSSSTNATMVYSTSESDGNVTDNTFQPMRIRVILSDEETGSQYLGDKRRAFLFEEILSPAILAWSAALRVNPVVGNLTVDASQLIDGVSCGPGINSGHPSVLVSPEHMTVGLANTDFVVYLSLSFNGEANETLVNQTSANETAAEGDSLVSDLNGGHDKELDPGYGKDKVDKSDNWVHHSRNETGVEGSDLYCAGDYLAAATYCSTDQNDRPTAALMHLCIGDDFFEEKRLRRNIVTVMHELGHTLGFNPQSMAHFRNSDGSPITERDDDGNVADRIVQCAGPESNKRYGRVPLPSEKIINFKTVRGGIRVAQVVTPSVKQVVRNHFDCQTLDGAELESGSITLRQEETTESCIGDHWERRLFRTDLMNAIIDDVPFKLRISPITLALFADSGWYQVDLSRTAYVDGWGRSAGCSFVDDDCVAADGHILESNEPFFCNQIADTINRGSIAEIQGCSPDMSRKAMCSIAKFDDALPSEFQYFNLTFGANVGGNEPLLDYCPVYSGFSNGICKEASSTLLTVSGIEEFGARNSRCLSGYASGQTTALCVPIACVIEDRTLRVQMDGNWEACKYTGQLLTIKRRGYTTSVVCPDVVRACPTFHCDRSCLGTDGTCDYITGKCMCAIPGGNLTLDGRNITECGITIPEASLGIFFEDPLLHKKNSTRPHINEDSPLADYYVPHERVLINRRRRPFLFPYVVGSVMLFICAVLVTTYIVRYRKHEDVVDVARRSWTRIFGRLPNINNHSTDDDDDGLELTWPTTRPVVPFRLNKDKFVASMLVDMRLHHPQQQQESASLPDTSGETDSNANISRSDMDDLDSCPSDLSSQAPLEESPPRQVMRRRFFKSDFI